MFKYEEISNYIVEGITNKALYSGNKLQSLRSTAKQFNCSVSVVLQAYEDLIARGIIKAVEKSGYFILPSLSCKIPEPQKYNHSLKALSSKTNNYTEKIIEMAMNRDILPLGAAIPDVSILSTKKIIKSLNNIIKDNTACINSYTPAKGSIELRIEIANYMFDKGVFIDPEEIVITNGCAEALYIAIQCSTNPGDTVAIETPVFFSLISILEKLKMNVVEIPTSPITGMELDILEEIIMKEKVKTVIFSPTFQNPLCSVMPPCNKKRLYHISEKYNLTLIEDDIYGDCSFDGQKHFPVKSFDKSKRIIYCSSFSKTLAPGLRIGWAIPGKRLDNFTNFKQISSLGGTLLTQLAIADYLKHGFYKSHLSNFQKNIYLQTTQMKMLIKKILPDNIKVSNPTGGYFLWLELDDKINSYNIHNIAFSKHIGIVPGPVFSSSDKYLNCIRISCGNPITEKIIKGLEVLDLIIRNEL